MTIYTGFNKCHNESYQDLCLFPCLGVVHYKVCLQCKKKPCRPFWGVWLSLVNRWTTLVHCNGLSGEGQPTFPNPWNQGCQSFCAFLVSSFSTHKQLRGIPFPSLVWTCKIAEGDCPFINEQQRKKHALGGRRKDSIARFCFMCDSIADLVSSSFSKTKGQKLDSGVRNKAVMLLSCTGIPTKGSHYSSLNDLCHLLLQWILARSSCG